MSCNVVGSRRKPETSSKGLRVQGGGRNPGFDLILIECSRFLFFSWICMLSYASMQNEVYENADVSSQNKTHPTSFSAITFSRIEVLKVFIH
jgi:hypothetical protein